MIRFVFSVLVEACCAWLLSKAGNADMCELPSALGSGEAEVPLLVAVGLKFLGIAGSTFKMRDFNFVPSNTRAAEAASFCSKATNPDPLLWPVFVVKILTLSTSPYFAKTFL